MEQPLRSRRLRDHTEHGQSRPVLDGEVNGLRRLWGHGRRVRHGDDKDVGEPLHRPVSLMSSAEHRRDQRLRPFSSVARASVVDDREHLVDRGLQIVVDDEMIGQFATDRLLLLGLLQASEDLVVDVAPTAQPSLLFFT